MRPAGSGSPHHRAADGRQNGVELPGIIWLAKTDPDAAAGERGPCRAGMLASVRGHRLCLPPSRLPTRYRPRGPVKRPPAEPAAA
jgi:hypothetical protein